MIIGIIVFVVMELASFLLPIILFFETNFEGNDPMTGFMRADTVKTLLAILVVLCAGLEFRTDQKRQDSGKTRTFDDKKLNHTIFKTQ